MDLRKWAAAAQALAPTVPAVPSTGYPTDGDPPNAIPATIPGAWWFHQVCEELRNVIVAAGMTPDHTDLDQLATAIFGGMSLPLVALDYPTVSTSDNKVGATVSSEVGTGGKVSVPASVVISLAQEVDAGLTGRMRTITTAAWQSASLLANSTYYLRAQFVGGVWTPYVQRGTDSDAVPAGLLGTPGAASGGGFDSTQLDVLLAKVVTGAAGSTPTITNLANARELVAAFTASSTGPGTLAAIWIDRTFTTNWARRPKYVVPAIIGTSSGSSLDGDLQFQISGVNRYTFVVKHWCYNWTSFTYDSGSNHLAPAVEVRAVA